MLVGLTRAASRRPHQTRVRGARRVVGWWIRCHDISEGLARHPTGATRHAHHFRILFYTGIRVGELLTLRWADIGLGARTLLVRRNLSAGVETEPKGRRHRYVPLPDPALAALARLGSRDEFVADDDYVLCNRWGRRLDASALRRRYQQGCEVVGLRRVKLHGLRHAAGSILARVADPVFVRDYLGHSKLSTTDRYVSAKHRPEDFERLNRAFESVVPEQQQAEASPSGSRGEAA